MSKDSIEEWDENRPEDSSGWVFLIMISVPIIIVASIVWHTLRGIIHRWKP